MNFAVLSDAEAVAGRGADVIAQEALRAVEARGRFLMAVSGGSTPWRMLALLADRPMAWPHVHLLQVDQRVVAASDPARNRAALRTSLLDNVAVAPGQVHAMPVEDADLDAGADRYAQSLLRRGYRRMTLTIPLIGRARVAG